MLLLATIHGEANSWQRSCQIIIKSMHLFGFAFQKNEIFHWMFTFSLNYDKIGAEVYNIATEQSGLYLIKAFLKLIYLNFFGLPAEANDSSYYFKQK